ncbi:hypothetical protein ZIOFF_002629 [Zingiber officinale]|uniref:Uncharacterized protein n=1 Tax=Zingiber officinale TaxID=94328 RepID=A0A8J5IBV4_ZINOF|nr:hypothetical protein ZIOFF_002629 [Zingiber officinale]
MLKGMTKKIASRIQAKTKNCLRPCSPGANPRKMIQFIIILRNIESNIYIFYLKFCL